MSGVGAGHCPRPFSVEQGVAKVASVGTQHGHASLMEMDEFYESTFDQGVLGLLSVKPRMGARDA